MFTTIRLLANVNPLEPNCLIEIANSTRYALSLRAAREQFEQYGKELKEKGYKVELEITTKNIIKL